VDAALAPRDRGTPADYDVVAICASAGGLSALSSVLSALPPDFPVPIVVVQHLDPDHPSYLASLLARRTRLPVVEAKDGEPLVAGRVYIAPPNHHLMITSDHRVELGSAEAVHFVRPSADTLFASIADVFSNRSIAVVLTGNGADGSSGALAIKHRGGLVIAQDEVTSEFFGMPQAAIDAGAVDLVLPLEGIGDALSSLMMGRVS
jgi:two-component system, chemotaxis family, protein-glutamate methylesterase/glutaminase